MILNRLNSHNLQEDIVPGMEFRLQPPFILYGKQSGRDASVLLARQSTIWLSLELFTDSLNGFYY